MTASVASRPPRRSAPLRPPVPVARKESCEVLCSGRKNQIKILNLSERVLINKAIYYLSVYKIGNGWGFLRGSEEQAYFWGLIGERHLAAAAPPYVTRLIIHPAD